MRTRDIFSRARETGIINHYDDGRFNSIDFMRTDLGGDFPPEGLHVVNPPNFEVEIGSLYADPLFYFDTVIHGVSNNWKGLGVLIFLLKMPIAAVSLLMGSAIMRILSLRGYVRPEISPNKIHINDLHAAVRLFDETDEKFANTNSHEFAHVLQAYDKKISLSSSFDNNRTALRALLPDGISKWIKYLSSEYEIQARLHTIMNNAYVQHGFMPGNKYELWACLISQGMTPPSQVLHIAQSDPACRAAFARYPKIPEYVKEHADAASVDQLHDIHGAIESEKQKFKLWDKVYPFVYGDIIEAFWGDRYGHVRLGHTHNIQLREIFMKAVDEHMTGKITPQDAKEIVEKTVSMMRVEDAHDLMLKLARGDAYKEHSPKVIFIPAGRLRLSLVAALALHPETTPERSIAVFEQNMWLPFRDWKLAMEGASAARRFSVPSIKRRRSKQPLADLAPEFS